MSTTDTGAYVAPVTETQQQIPTQQYTTNQTQDAAYSHAQTQNTQMYNEADLETGKQKDSGSGKGFLAGVMACLCCFPLLWFPKYCWDSQIIQNIFGKTLGKWFQPWKWGKSDNDVEDNIPMYAQSEPQTKYQAHQDTTTADTTPTPSAPSASLDSHDPPPPPPHHDHHHHPPPPHDHHHHHHHDPGRGRGPGRGPEHGPGRGHHHHPGR